MISVDFEFYSSVFGGNKVPEEDWKRMSLRAGQRVDQATFGRLAAGWESEPYANGVKCAVCEVADILHQEDARDGKTSENIDGYSVSWGGEERYGNAIANVISVYLGQTGLMYKGVDEEC